MNGRAASSPSPSAPVNGRPASSTSPSAPGSGHSTAPVTNPDGSGHVTQWVADLDGSDHVTQLVTNPDGSVNGRDDCWEACLASYLRDHHYAGLPAEDEILLQEVALLARGIPDAEGNAPTTLPEAEASLRRYRVGYRWTGDYLQSLQSLESIVLVDGTLLAPPQYPPSWIGQGGASNHFIRWLPARAGDPSWFMDPLAPADCRYDLASVQRAFYGAYILSDPARTVRQACALKTRPDHAGTALARLQAGQAVDPTGRFAYAVPGPWGKEDWAQVRAGEKTGWVPAGMVG